ncbi:hypothetical protein pqer_cds_79 [Pandoravirus quercus]|uniref:Uncharacterized protein n=1 Tax=Pandoravirus quercus TaxID=2107709 RepID=A0A2U7U7V0_9VIRU|nr:hypothetical protein pqer_cds_79 [Pandoravirus quercus]AVK74501.1 hypothetical protein pqer_cds_79 [Pandoravirus quercus]
MAASNNLWVNYVVAGSNILALWPIWHAPTPWHMALAVAAMGASTLMHISERKHNLPGVAPLNAWSKQIEWVDRGVAYASIVFVLWRVLARGGVSPWIWPIGLGGLAMLGLAEHCERGPVWFAVTHCTWHACAYVALALAFV